MNFRNEYLFFRNGEFMEKKLNYYKLYKMIFFITFAFISIIDTVNGFFIESFGFGISIIYRLLILLIFTLYLYQNNSKKNSIFMSMLILYLLIIGIFNIYIYQEYDGIYNEISQVSKLIFIIVSIESFNLIIKTYEEKIKLINKIINWNIILFPLCVIIPHLLDIGLDVYSGQIGSKGFFNSNNELAIVLSCLLVFSVNQLYKKVSLKNIIKTFILTYSILLVSSKTGIASIICIYVFYFIKSIFKLKVKFQFAILVFISIVFSVIILNKQIILMMNEFLQRQKFLFDLSSNSLAYTLSGGRNSFLILIYNYTIESKFGLIKLIFGYGIHTKEAILGRLFLGANGLKSIEMDFFDILFSYGLIGLILIYGYFIFKYIKLKNCYTEFKLSYCILLIIGAFSGHVLWNAMAGSILVITVCGMDASNGKVLMMKGKGNNEYTEKKAFTDF